MERFSPVMPAVEGCVYKLPEGTGRYVGVAGREIGVGIEPVVVVLRLPADRRDCGRRVLAFIAKEFDLPSAKVGEGLDVGTLGRNAVGAEGLESRRVSLSFSFGGEGESSMIRTHPEESPPELFLFLSESMSLFRLAENAELLLEDEDDAAIPLAALNDAGELRFGRLARLPIRNRGTRVWIFCSRFRTRARISETI